MSDAALRVARRAGPWLWGACVAGWLCRHYAGLGPGEMPRNHEAYNYVYRIIEFRDLLRAGYLFPQWASDFRGGLGSPYFGYYQPGFFYVASAFASLLPLPQAIAATLWSLALVGYGGMLALVRARFGLAGGLLAATALLLSPYARAELYLRGDFSEFTGMMLLAPTLHWLTAWLDGGRRWHWWAMVVSAAAMLCSHPVAGLLGYGTLVTVTACWVAMGCERRRAGAALGALGAAIGLDAFYLTPLVLEWDLVAGFRAVTATANVRLAFIDLATLYSWRPRPSLWPGFIQWAFPVERVQVALAGLAVAASVWRWRHRTAGQRRLVVALFVVGVGATWIMHPTSQALWDALPLVRFLQFPWRALFVLTIALAALTGCVVERRRLVAAIGIGLCAASVYGFKPLPVRRWTEPASARAMAEEFVQPDIANEWLPRGAFGLYGSRIPTAPTCDGGVCRITGFERGTGRLQARVTMIGRARVTLPHYYFPVGWVATFDGAPVPLEATRDGLMQVTLERGTPIDAGLLDVRFSTTPARRLGVALSAAVALALALGAAVRARRVAPSLAGALALALVALGASGCRSVGYLARGGLAEARILWRREPISRMLARPDLDPDLRERLALVLAARRFAADTLGLRVGDSFSSFADTDGEAIVWVVSAAHRDRLEAYTWWYPIVGRVPYQGYFERADAERAAQALAANDLDVDVRPASAFSTLGWFADPLLSTTARGAPILVVETVLHELFHATLYVPSAVAFNESAATFVGFRGAAAFFCEGPASDVDRCRETQERWRRVRMHARLLARYVGRVRALYAAGLPPATRERRRATLAAQAARAISARGLGPGDELSPPNNARLLSMLAYETDLGAFERLAPSAAALPGAIGRIVAAARGAADPFVAVRALAPPPLQTRLTGLDSGVAWLPSLLPWTRCSAAWPVGYGSSATTSRTVPICTAPAWSRARAARAG